MASYGAGIPVESTKGEAAAGQGELNIRYGAPIETADYHTIAKNAAKEIAWSQGRALTLWRNGTMRLQGHPATCINRSGQPMGPNRCSMTPDGPYGMSEMMQHFLAGQLQHASEFTYFLAPNINSYKRFQAQTFAPTKAVWSSDNRTAGYRICGADSPAVRVECRVGGADLNPYLAFAALLAAGIAGIEAKLALEPEARGDAYAETGGRAIPPTLRAATTRFKAPACSAQHLATMLWITMSMQRNGSRSSMIAVLQTGKSLADLNGAR